MDILDILHADATDEHINSLQRIVKLTEELDAQRAKLAELNGVAAALANEIRKLEEKTIPDAMAEIGITDFTLTDGRKVSVAQEIHCGISQSNLHRALAWLRATNNDGIIRHIVGVKFGKGNDVAAAELALYLQEKYGANLEVLDNETVHPQTLKAFVKEALQDTPDFPEDLFGVYKINRVALKPRNTQE